MVTCVRKKGVLRLQKLQRSFNCLEKQLVILPFHRNFIVRTKCFLMKSCTVLFRLFIFVNYAAPTLHFRSHADENINSKARH